MHSANYKMNNCSMASPVSKQRIVCTEFIAGFFGSAAYQSAINFRVLGASLGDLISLRMLLNGPKRTPRVSGIMSAKVVNADAPSAEKLHLDGSQRGSVGRVARTFCTPAPDPLYVPGTE